MQEFIKNNFKVKIADAEDELYQVRKLRYEELVLMHRKAEEMPFEQSYTDEDRDCANLVVIDMDNNTVVGSYRFITKEMLNKPNSRVEKFCSEYDFNVDDIKNQPYGIMELGKAAVHHDYRNGSVVKLMFQGAVRYAKEHGLRMLFGVATFPEMSDEELKTVSTYLYHNYKSQDPSLQPYALEPSIPMDAMPYEQVDVRRAKQLIPPILKAYLAVGCKFGKTACPCYKLLNSIGMIIMLDLDNINERYAAYVLR